MTITMSRMGFIAGVFGFIFTASLLLAEVPIHPVTKDLPAVVNPSTKAKDELVTLDFFIESTKSNLSCAEAIKGMIKDYQRVQELYLKNADDKESCYRMVKTARRVLESVKENHLTQMFDQEFISELTLFSQMAAKMGIPRI